MIFQNTVAKAGKRTSVLVLLGALALAGCDESIALTQAGNDPSDQCNSFRQTIVAARQTDINAQAQSAAVGALAGALIGAALNADGSAQDRRRGALLGALGGGLVGFSGTYYRQQSQRAADANALLRSVNTDAAAERGLVTRTGRAAAGLRQCRETQLRTLERQVRAGSVTPAQARAQLNAIKTKVNGDNQIISASFNGIGQRVNAYVDATATAAQVDRAAVAASRPPSRARNVQQARASSPNVRAVVQDQNRQVSVDQQAKARVDNRIEALEILVG